VENERQAITCILMRSTKGSVQQFEDMIRASFAAAWIPDQRLMTELTFIQDHIIKNMFLIGDYPVSSEAGSWHSARKGLRSFSVLSYQDTDACHEDVQRSTRRSQCTSGFDGLYTIRIIGLFSFMGVKGHGQISFSRQTSQD